MKYPWLTYAVVGVNVLVFALMGGEGFADALVLDNEALSHPWTVLSYGFAHRALLHLAVNMVVLIIVGRWLERRVSRAAIIAAYLGGALAGGLVFVGLNALAGGAMQLCGASAAVLAVASMAAQTRSDATVAVGGWRVSVRSMSYMLVAVIVASLILGSNPGGDAAHLAGVAVGMAIGRKLMQSPDTEAIRAKMERSGYASLNESERKALFNESKKK